MDSEPVPTNLVQTTLFDFSAASTGAVELFPSVWSALEDLVSADLDLRRSGLERLLELSAPRLSPLTAYIIATRLAEPDRALRAQVMLTLAAVLSPDERGLAAPEAVTRVLHMHLSQMKAETIENLLTAVAQSQSLAVAAARLLNACPHAGETLAEIISDRKQPMEIRIQAAYLTGTVGFLDALPAIERLEARLTARLEGQQAMPFAPPSLADEKDLLPALRAALEQLQAR